MKKYIWLFLLAATLPAQTRVNGTKQFRLPDFAGQSFSRPWPVGANLPVACRAGEVFFQDNSQTGKKLYLCSNTNFWKELGEGGSGGGGSASQSADLLDFTVTRASDTQLLVGEQCSITKPCRARVGTKIITQTGPATVQITGTSSTGNLFIYIDEGGVKAAHNTSATVSCNSACQSLTGVTEFPVFSLPLLAVPFNGNVFAQLTPAMDRRAFLGTIRMEPGASGNVKLLANSTTGGVQVDLSTSLDFGGFVSTKITKRGSLAQRPAACEVGELFYQTDETSGLYHCPAPNQWTALSSSGSGTLEILTEGILAGAREKLNFSAGTGTGLSCADDPDNGRVTCTFSLDAVQLNSDYSRLGAFTNTYLAGHVSDFRAASGLYLPVSTAASPTQSGQVAFETNTLRIKLGSNGGTQTVPVLSETVTTAGSSGLLNISGGSSSSGRTVDVVANPDLGALNSVKPFKRGTDAPATCAVGDTFHKTNAPVAAQLLLCTSTDTWTAQGTTAMHALNITFDTPPTIAAGATSYATSGVQSLSTTRANRRAYAAYDVLLDRLYVITSSAQPGSSPANDLTCRVSINDVDSSLTVVVPGGAAAGTYTNLANSIAVPAGSYWQIGCQNAAGSASANLRGFALRMAAQ